MFLLRFLISLRGGLGRCLCLGEGGIGLEKATLAEREAQGKATLHAESHAAQVA